MTFFWRPLSGGTKQFLGVVCLLNVVFVADQLISTSILKRATPWQYYSTDRHQLLPSAYSQVIPSYFLVSIISGFSFFSCFLLFSSIYSSRFTSKVLSSFGWFLNRIFCAKLELFSINCILNLNLNFPCYTSFFFF